MIFSLIAVNAHQSSILEIVALDGDGSGSPTRSGLHRGTTPPQKQKKKKKKKKKKKPRRSGFL